MAVDTRDRIITATVELFRRHGFNGTSLKQVTVAAAAPVGSLYHFFPGGKEELAEAAIATSGRAYQELFEVIYDAAATPADAVSDFFEGAAAVLEETGYLDICPIGTVALEVASTNERLRRATAAVLEDWHRAAVSRLRAAGAGEADARALATTLVACLEGAFMLSRAAQSRTPLLDAGRLMRQLVDQVLGEAARSRGRAAPKAKGTPARRGSTRS